jgi:Ca2+-binding RTX toxin-like protein
MRASMKRLIAPTTLLLGATGLIAAGPAAGADPALRSGQTATASAFTLVLTGGNGPNDVTVSFEAAEYVIRANGEVPPPNPAEVPNDCYNPPGNPNEMRCPERDLHGLVVRGRGGNDTINVRRSVEISVILNGGAGLDDLAGGSNTDKLTGGEGDDRLFGRGGADFLYGGAGNDELFGGAGKDLLRGGPGRDELFGGRGRDDTQQ